MTPTIPENEEARLAALRALDVLDTAPELLFDDIVSLAASICGTPIALVSLVDSERQWFKARVGLDAPETHRDISFCGHAVADGALLVVPDAAADPRFASNPLVLDAPSIRMYAGAPLIDSEGHALGTLCVIDRRARELTPAQLSALQLLARQVVGHLEVRRAVAMQRAYLEHKARFDALFRLSRDPIALLSPGGAFIEVNEAWEHALGWDAETLVGSLVDGFVHPADLPATREARARLESVGAAEVENRMRGEDGEWRWMRWAQVRDPGRDLVYAVVSDVTDRRRLQALQDEFVSTVSHELRTPLTSIHGALRLVVGGAMGEVSEAIAEVLRIAEQNSDRLVRLINDLLDVQATAAGQVKVRPVSCAPEDLLQRVVDEARGLARPRGVAIVLGEVVSRRVAADRDRIGQVLTNLVSNAVRHSPEGGRVTLAASDCEGGVRFSVTDQGPGIPPALRARIFERFVRGTDGPSGTGLGLAIASALVEQHQGRLAFDCPTGGGTTFWFTLPLGPARPPSARSSGPVTMLGPRLSILYVEDDADLVSVVTRSFRHHAGLVAAPSLEAARAALRQRQFDLVILDIGLPDGSGLDLLDTIHQLRPGTPVVVFSDQEIEGSLPINVLAAMVKSREWVSDLLDVVLDLADPGAERRST